MSDQDWIALDRDHVWHPYTRAKTGPPPLSIVDAEGVYLHTADGRRVLDGISSWWVNIHGHSHPRLNRALADQAERFAQVIFAGTAHEPAARLARALVERAPAGLSRVFYSDDGSTAVEAALKLALQYWRNRGDEGRDLFVALENGYHGETFGAMGVSATTTFHGHFEDLFFDVRRVRAPRCARCPETGPCERCGAPAGLELEDVLGDEGDRVAAVIIEPMLQGAAGMIVWPPDFLRHVGRVTRQAGTLLIADEVFTGFGRTGTFLACEHGPVDPDILCLSKALTGGYLPLAATLATEEIYRAFHDEPGKAFLHGHSFTGNALGCAVALESLSIFEDQRWLERVAELEALFAERLERLARHDAVIDARGIGALAALTLRPAGAGGYLDERGPRIAAAFLDRDILLRPLGNVLYFLPPYVVTDEEAHRVFDAMDEVIGQL